MEDEGSPMDEEDGTMMDADPGNGGRRTVLERGGMTARPPESRIAGPRAPLLALALFVLGALLVLEINDSPLLPGAHADSVEYMEAARSLVSGGGLSLPMTSWASPDTLAPLSHFPPGPSLAMASVMRATGVRPDVAALWIMALAAGATLALTFLLVSETEGWLVGFLSAVLVAALPPFVMVHAAIWSEPLYLPLLLLTLILLVRSPQRPGRAGVAAAASVLVRYLGLATVVSVGLWTFRETRSWRKTLVGLGPGVGVFLAWFFVTRIRGGAMRTWGAFRAPFSDTVAQLPEMIRFWLVPNLPLLVAVALLLGVLATHLGVRRSLRGPLWILIATHLGLILGSRLLVDQRIPFDARILLPVLVLLTVPVVPVLWKRPLIGPLVLLVWMGWVGSQDVQGIRTAQAVGLYYTDARWLGSGLLPWLDAETGETRIYSNEPGFVAFHLRRTARFLPLRTQDLGDFLRVWKERPGAILILQPQRPDEWTVDAYLAGLPVEAAFRTRDGVVLLPK
jgi:hypothetical protein